MVSLPDATASDDAAITEQPTRTKHSLGDVESLGQGRKNRYAVGSAPQSRGGDADKVMHPIASNVL